MDRFILALDASTSCVGYCAIGVNGINTGQYLPKGETGWQKIFDFARWLNEMLMLVVSLNEPMEAYLFYERPTGNSGNMDTNLKLGALMYQAMCCARSFKFTFVEVTATQVKKTGVYKGQLEQASKVAGKTFDVIRKKDGSVNKAAMDRQDNEIDAIGVWLAGLEKMKC